MKDILYKKRCNTAQRTKVFSILQKMEDAECVTKIHKAFRYEIYPSEKENAFQLGSPQAYIRKTLNTQKAIEKFSFQVKGSFYITYQDHFLKVDFQHTLNIHLKWKSKSLLQQNSTILA